MCSIFPLRIRSDKSCTVEANSPEGIRSEELSQNVSPVADTFFYLSGPGADLLVVVCLKYPAALTNLQKQGEPDRAFTSHTFLCAAQMQEKARVKLRWTLFSCCNIEAAEVCRFVIKSTPSETTTWIRSTNNNDHNHYDLITRSWETMFPC